VKHKIDLIAAAWAGVVMGVFIMVIGFSIDDKWVAGIGAAAFFGGLYLLRNE
jgi:hypothetical protein